MPALPKLTKTVLEAAPLRDKQYTLWCSDLPGFGAYILPTGKRTYFVDYRNAAGVRRRLTIGRHGTITAEEARKLAVVTMASAVKGEDPADERVTRRKSLAVGSLCDEYFKAAERGLIMGKRGTAKKPSTLAVDRGRVERHIKPLLGSKLVRDIDQADVARFIRDVTIGKTAADIKTEKARGRAIVEGGRGTAARTAGLLGGILSYAVAEGIIPTNPARGVKRPSDAQRTRRLTPAEFKALGAALAEAERAGERWQVITGVRLLALSGCRLKEIERLKASEIDFEGMRLRLEDSKEGRSIRPVGGAFMALLLHLKNADPRSFALPGVRSDSHFGGLPGGLERVMKAAELPGVSTHTLRHSYGSVAGDLGFSDSTIAALLGHAGGSVTRRYIT
jgi:integrase